MRIMTIHQLDLIILVKLKYVEWTCSNVVHIVHNDNFSAFDDIFLLFLLPLFPLVSCVTDVPHRHNRLSVCTRVGSDASINSPTKKHLVIIIWKLSLSSRLRYTNQLDKRWIFRWASVQRTPHSTHQSVLIRRPTGKHHIISCTVRIRPATFNYM